MKYWLYSLCFPLHHCKLLISYLVVWTSWSSSPVLSVFPYLFLLVTISLFSVSESVSVLLYSFVLFFRFTCKRKCAEFVFLCLTYFTKHNTLQVQTYCKWQIFIFFMAEQYFFVCIFCILFILSSVAGHLGCFYILASVHNATMNIEMHFFWFMFFL